MAMVQFMASNHVGEGTYGNLVVARYTTPGPGCIIESTKERHGRLSNRCKLINKTLQGAMCERSILHVVILLKAGERSLVIAGDAQCPVAENALGINDVSQRFLDTPFSRSITKISARLRSCKKRESHRQLAFQSDENVSLGNQGNVFAVIGCVLVGFGTGGRK